MDNSGSLNAQVIHQLGPGLRSKMAIQVSGRMESAMAPSLPSCPWVLKPRTQGTVQPNKLKHQSLEQRKAYCKDQARNMSGWLSTDQTPP